MNGPELTTSFGRNQRPPGWVGHRSVAASGRLDGWFDGYTADAMYTDLVNVDMCPAWLSMISVFNGEPPLDLDRPLVWLDLGCGTGLGTCTVAAGNPSVEVWGVDYNPAHVERGRDLAYRAGLTNCQFVEASFEEFAQDQRLGPDEVDVVVVNGVYSWVSPGNQRHIVETIRRRLRPGGLAYVMYESATGWSSMTPLAEALRLYVDADGQRSDLAFHDAAAALLELRHHGARYFPMGQRESQQMDQWPTSDGLYAAHEYLGANFAPTLVDEVFSALAGAKCSFVGGIGALDHDSYYSTPPELADLFDGASDPVTANLALDLALERQIRRDLFRRGRSLSTPLDHRARLEGLTFGGLGRPFEEKPIDLAAMQVTLDPAFHVPLVEALTSSDLDIDGVLAIHPSWSFGDAATALALLVAGGYAAPLAPTKFRDDARGPCQRLNDVLLAEQRRGRYVGGRLSPSTGAMIAIDEVELLALDALQSGEPDDASLLVEQVASTLEGHGRVVSDHGELIVEADAARAVIRYRVTALMSRNSTLARLGVDERSVS